jgi:hypothetical protein
MGPFQRGAARLPEAHYAWRPGAPPPRPPRAAWPRAAGVVLAIAAQGALYLSLRHVATAHWPSWAHHHVRPGPLPWPTLVPTDIVKGGSVAGNGPLVPPPPVLPSPVLSPAPEIPIPAPDLGTGSTRSG